MYATSETICEIGASRYAALAKLSPPNCMPALTTPINAPPAMKPEASSVAFSFLRWFRLMSVDRELTYQFTKPPTISGKFSCKGMNIPKAKARAETPQQVSMIEMIAPMP